MHQNLDLFCKRVMFKATTLVVMDGTLGQFFKPEKNLDFFRLKHWHRDAYPGKLE